MLLLKVDFAKAFDIVSWTFLDNTLKQMNFEDKWRNWIKGCLKSARVSVLINGTPTPEFSTERGLRQGDPLSPFLFILAGEALNIMMDAAISQQIFVPMSVGSNDTVLSHLQFADDATFIENGLLTMPSPSSHYSNALKLPLALKSTLIR